MDDLDQKDAQISEPSADVDAYVNYYGLIGDPFDPQKPLFFTTAQLEKSLRLFNYLARFSRKLVVVTGAPGVGKTALLENFVNGQGEEDLVCSFAALASDSPAQVLLEMAEQLQLPELIGSETPAQLGQAIRAYSLECLDQDNNCLVVIDDAELFTQPVLEQLYQLTVNEPGQRCGISLLLCGQPELVDNVRQVVPVDIVDKAVFHQPITPFSCEEVAKYLHLHFIENAGQNKAPFSQNEYKAIFDQSEGMPERINDAAKQVLLAGMGGLIDGDVAVKKKPRGLVFALVGLLVVAGAGFLFWQSGGKQAEPGDLTAQSLVGQIERENEQGADEAIQDGSEDEAVEQLFVEAAPEVKAEAEVVDTSFIPDSEGAGDEEVGVAANEASGEQEFAGAAAQSKSNEQQQPEAASKTSVEVAEQPQEIEEVKERKVAAHVLTDEVAVAAPGIKTIPQIEAKAVSAESSSRLTQDTARILAFKSTDYTMQLLGSHKEESIKKILDKLPEDSQLMYFQKTHKGAPWYVLIYGDYPDRAAANAAAEKLPKALKGFKPWVRSVLGIQDAIKENQ